MRSVLVDGAKGGAECSDSVGKVGAILARSPDDPQRIRVASVFEFSICLFSDCLSVCLFSVGKFSNLF